MKIRKRLSILIMINVLMFVCSLAPSVFAQKAIEWRMISSWGTENPNVRNIFIPFVQKVAERTAGRVKISWVGPEAVPPFEQLKPVREGLFDASFTHSAYHMGEVSVGTAMDLIYASGKERRAAGLYKILDEAYREKANVTYLSGTPNGTGYHLILKKKIDRADLTGLKIRATLFYDPLIKGLGGAPVRIGGGEIYTALERGVVDGTAWGTIGMMDYKWYEVAKYVVRPCFGDNIFQILVNQNSWNTLPNDLKDLLTKTAVEIEEHGRSAILRMLENEEKELKTLGIEFLILPPKEAERYLKIFSDRSWEELILKRDPKFGPLIKAAVDRMRKK